ncbi:hypothetical protein G9A89_017542 [Geosiphon pyriformis]|nr:hypothetical protein G9A89_017542 [Geosiphon pyriformis]
MSEHQSFLAKFNFEPKLDYISELADTFLELRKQAIQAMEEGENRWPLEREKIDSVGLGITSSFARLRDLNRRACLLKLADKNATQTARLGMDDTHLQLQNLISERGYLRREIAKCRNNRFIYQSIPLISEREFLEEAPDEYKSIPTIEGIEENEDLFAHHRMLQRLRYEESQRKRLEAERDEKHTRKTQLSARLAEKRAKIEQVNQEVAKYFQESEALQHILGLQNGTINGTSSSRSRSLSPTLFYQEQPASSSPRRPVNGSSSSHRAN